MEPPPIPPSSRGPSRKAIGCGLLLGGLFLVLVALLVWLALRPRRGLEVAQVAGPDAVLVVHLRDVRSDPGVRQLLEQVHDLQTRAFREQMQQAVPPGARGLGEVFLRFSRVGRMSSASIPEVILALEPPRGTNEVEVIAAARLGGMARLMTTLIVGGIHKAGGAAGHTMTHRGRSFMDLGGDGYLYFHRGVAVYSTHRACLEGVMDRMLDGAAGPALTERIPPDERERWDLVVVGDNQHGLSGFLDAQIMELDADDEGAPRAPGFEDVQWGWLGIDLHTGDWLRVKMSLECRDETEAGALGRAWKQWLDSRFDALHAVGLQAMLLEKTRGPVTQLELDVTGIQAAMGTGFEYMLNQADPPSGAGPVGEGRDATIHE